MPSGSAGNAQAAFGACAIALVASVPARIVVDNSGCSIFPPELQAKLATLPLAVRVTCRLH